MPNYTTNYNLTKPLGSELYDINVHNENMDKVDEALKNLEESAVTEVSADIVTAGTFAGAVKANATAVADVTVVQIRNVACGTADVADVLGDLNVGDLYFTVEEAT